MDKAWSSKEIDSMISDISTFNGEDSSKFREWYLDLRKKNKGILLSVYDEICSLKLNGFLGTQDDPQFHLALMFTHNTWVATKFAANNHYHEMKQNHEASFTKRNEILDTAKKFRKDIDFLPSIYLAAITPKNEHSNNPYDFWRNSLDTLINLLDASKKSKTRT